MTISIYIYIWEGLAGSACLNQYLYHFVSAFKMKKCQSKWARAMQLKILNIVNQNGNYNLEWDNTYQNEIVPIVLFHPRDATGLGEGQLWFQNQGVEVPQRGLTPDWMPGCTWANASVAAFCCFIRTLARRGFWRPGTPSMRPMERERSVKMNVGICTFCRWQANYQHLMQPLKT